MDHVYGIYIDFKGGHRRLVSQTLYSTFDKALKAKENLMLEDEKHGDSNKWEYLIESFKIF